MQSIKQFHFRNDTSRPNKRNKIKNKLVSKEVQNLPMEHLEICRFFFKKNCRSATLSFKKKKQADSYMKILHKVNKSSYSRKRLNIDN